MWTAIALGSEATPRAGAAWRVVEHQHTASTRKLTDSLVAQDLLESILEQSKPAYAPGAEALDYLLETPFRYHPPRRHGSRFGRASPGQGVFYAAEHRRTALAEHAFWQRRFFAASPGTPLPRLEVRLTVFAIEYNADACLDLTQPPLSRYRNIWTDPDDYTQTQALGDRVRAEGVDMLRYESVRDPESGVNLALLSPTAFAARRPTAMQTWYLHFAKAESHVVRAEPSRERWTFQVQTR